MSEQIHDQVSAFIDDELSAEECAFLVRRFERDPESRTRLVRYSLIGSALRGELFPPDPDALRRRVYDALNGAPAAARQPAAAAVSAPPAPRTGQRRWARPAAGVGVAASVAVVSLLVFRNFNQAEDVESAPITVFSAIVPTDSVQAVQGNAPVPPIRLTNYLLHHGEYARLSRTSVHSTVVGSMEQPFVIDAVMDSVMLDDTLPQAERDIR